MNFKNKLISYLARWEEKNIITSQQKWEILKDIENESSGATFLRIISTIWAICIWIWVLLVISANWSAFPKTLQLFLSLALPISSLLVAYYFMYIQKELNKIGQAFALLWWLFIGASIALIGQIYNLDGTVWRLLLMWFILLLPILYLFKLKTLSVLATGLFYGVCYYYVFEVFFTSWKDEQTILMIFSLISTTTALLAYLWNKVTKQHYDYLFYPVAAISLKVLLFVLFLGTIDEHLTFIADGMAGFIIHNILFLVVVFWIMYWANKNHELLLRHASFVWFGIWLTWKYFDIVWSYMQWWIFFIVSWIVLIWMVYTMIKINKKLWN